MIRSWIDPSSAIAVLTGQASFDIIALSAEGTSPMIAPKIVLQLPIYIKGDQYLTSIDILHHIIVIIRAIYRSLPANYKSLS